MMRNIFYVVLLLPSLSLAAPNIHMHNVRIKEYNQQGELQRQLTTPELKTQAKSETTTVKHPQLKQQKVTITADSAQVRHKDGVSVFTGNVKITQGDTLITGDKIEINYDKHQQLTKAITYGTPARYIAQNAKNKTPLHAHAKAIVYHAASKRIELLGDAKATQGTNSISGQHINYDMQKSILTTPHDNQHRTTVTFYPKEHA